jgi:hypothetical protein
VKPRRTVASNHVLRLEGGNEDNDLWVTAAASDDETPVMCSTWELTADERERIAAGENVELIVFGTGHPPVQMRLTNVPIGGHMSRREIADRLRGMGNDALADLFLAKTTAELRDEFESRDLPDELRSEVLAFVQLLGDDDEWPYDDDPPDPL